MKKTIGGDRLGAGNKMTVDLRTYNRSSHDQGFLFRTTMAPGTLVPIQTEVGLPGTTFDIDLRASVMTHPTVGPLFGSYKLQIDYFKIPIRLYQAQLHNNRTRVGLNMESVKLPQIRIKASDPDFTLPLDIDNCQINPSCLLSYLDIRGVGFTDQQTANKDVTRDFNAVPYLAYWDIYKNYYANKQEEMGAFIHTEPQLIKRNVTAVATTSPTGTITNTQNAAAGITVGAGTVMNFTVTSGTELDPTQLLIYTNLGSYVTVSDAFASFTKISATVWSARQPRMVGLIINWWGYRPDNTPMAVKPTIKTFSLEMLDNMREDILAAIKQSSAFLITDATYTPYGDVLKGLSSGAERQYSKLYSQEGLALKTYNSDLLNNWMANSWIDGEDSINQLTTISTTSGGFTIDALTMARKIYDVLNRIAVSGGTYQDWIDASYTHEAPRMQETPSYVGGMMQEIVFEEVVSTSATQNEKQPLGTLGGRGVLHDNKRGGKIVISCDEPCYIMGIASITPRIDYSQGNKWDVHLKTMNDFHKPGLDEIGFQDLLSDQMAWWDSYYSQTSNTWVRKQVGKQPAWINYMTNINKVRGNFAIQSNEMFMTLNRRYESALGTFGPYIKDKTTYIDPSKFNHVFAQTELDAQNFWLQVAIDMTSRRKMSAKLMPNL